MNYGFMKLLLIMVIKYTFLYNLFIDFLLYTIRFS